MLTTQTKAYDIYEYHYLETIVQHEPAGLEYLTLYDEVGESLRHDLTDSKGLYELLDLYRELSRRYNSNGWEPRFETAKASDLIKELLAK